MPSNETTERPHSKRRLILAIAGTVVVLDAATKAIATRALAGRGVVNVLGGSFHLELYRNFAGPGNILQGHPMLVSLLSLIAVTLIAFVAWSVRTTSYAVAIGLLLGGGAGNLLDRLLRAPGPLRGGVIRLDQADALVRQPQHRRPFDQRRGHRDAGRARTGLLPAAARQRSRWSA